MVEGEFASGGLEEVAAASLALDQDELERGLGDAHREPGEAAAGADIGDAGELAHGQEPGCAEGDEEGERFAEEAAGDRGGLGDGGECGAIVPLEEEPMVPDEGLALGVVESDSEPGGLIGECGQQLAGVVVAG